MVSSPSLSLLCLETTSPAICNIDSYKREPKHVLSSLRSWEKFYTPSTADIINQVAVASACARSIVAEWIAQVAVNTGREDEVFSYAVNLFTRMLTKFDVKRKEHLQLFGGACLHLASKLLEAVPLTLKDVAYYTDSTYSVSELQDAETIVMHAVNFDLCSVPPRQFIGPLLSLLGLDLSDHEVGCIKREALRRINICLILPEFTTCLPSTVAAAALLTTLAHDNPDCKDVLSRALSSLINCQQETLLNMMERGLEAWAKHAHNVYEDVPVPHCALKTSGDQEFYDEDALFMEDDGECVVLSGTRMGNMMVADDSDSGIHEEDDGSNGFGETRSFEGLICEEAAMWDDDM